jgi:hypothetical protein
VRFFFALPGPVAKCQPNRVKWRLKATQLLAYHHQKVVFPHLSTDFLHPFEQKIAQIPEFIGFSGLKICG